MAAEEPLGWRTASICILYQKYLYKINQAGKQASKLNDLTQTSQASKLKVSKIASQQAEASQLGLLAYYPLCLRYSRKAPIGYLRTRAGRP